MKKSAKNQSRILVKAKKWSKRFMLLKRLSQLDAVIETLTNKAVITKAVVLGDENGLFDKPNLPGHNYYIPYLQKFKPVAKCYFKVYTFPCIIDLLNFNNAIKEHFDVRWKLEKDFNFHENFK
jgi:hypothetical protein